MKSGRDQMVIDPDPDEIYTKRKKRIVNVMMSSTPSSSPSVKYRNDSWGNSLERMSSFTRAEMNQHITNSGIMRGLGFFKAMIALRSEIKMPLIASCLYIFEYWSGKIVLAFFKFIRIE